jgi:benzoyl-CoA 2,3-dioxygenase component A
MNAPDAVAFIRQHLIDPEVCIRCNTCEESCPIDAITHDGRNYVVDPAICNGCNACISPCPTGSIDHWHVVPKTAAYTLAEQFGWDELPPADEKASAVEAASAEAAAVGAAGAPTSGNERLSAESPQANAAVSPSSTRAPWSAAHPYLNLYSLKKPLAAMVAGNFRLTAAGAESDVRHIVLDLGTQFMPLLEGQSIGVIPPGQDASGRPHYLRMYSVASPRTGEREGYNNLSLTVKRVTLDHEGRPTVGVASNYLCDLQRGATVHITGPFGERFLMPNHPASNILMICTGTGSAPMRAMTEHRRRLKEAGKAIGGKLMLFFGARKPEELPYFGPLAKLPPELMDTTLAFSRVPGQPRAYVQDRIRERARDVAELLRGDAFVYLCGLKGMETGVLEALQEACTLVGLHWPTLHRRMVDEGRFHVETY